MPIIDLAFKVIGTRVPVEHGYALYAALFRLVPAIHEADEIGVHPIGGRYHGKGILRLGASSRLVLRMPDTAVPLFIKLTGKMIEVDGHRLTIDVPKIRLLKPAATLYARLVTIKRFLEPEPFLEAAKRQSDAAGITANLRLGERRTFCVKDKQVVGFEMFAAGLDAESSLTLQEVGIGSRRQMGCGIFVPFRR